MDCSPRLRQILLIMLQENQIISVKKLAEDIKVSKRTVQREFEAIGTSLEEYKVSVQTKAGVGVWLEGKEIDKKRLYEFLKKEDVIDYGDKENRRKRLVFEILKDRTPKKLYYYGAMFGVSEATISNDMEVIEDWFKPFNLKIVRKQGYGVELEGSEKNYRVAVRKFIEEQDIYNLLNKELIERVVACILSIKDNRIIRMTENSYIGLIYHVTIAIARILQGEIIESNYELLEKVHKSEEEDYELALYIANSLEKEFKIKIPEIEVVYISLHIKGAKLQYIVEDNIESRSRTEREELIDFIYQMIEVYDEELAFELKQDEEFIVGLLAHLLPTFTRLKNHMLISNPLLQQIKDTYPEIFEKCYYVGELIEKNYGYKVPETEIGFLAMHFGAAIVRLENKKDYNRKVEIGIVCASGIGISRFMLTKLKYYLKERAELATFSQESLTKKTVESMDFFIASIELDNVEADIIRVNPILTERDLEQIDKKVRVYARIPKKKNVEVDFSKQLEQVNFIVSQIKTIIKDFTYIKVNNEITFDELLVAVTEKLQADYKKAILIQENIKDREKLASQIIPEYDFALLHTRTKGVIKPSFSICLTKDFGRFLDPYLSGIHVVIIMLMPEDDHEKENREILGYLSSKLVEDNDFLNVINKGEKENIRNYMSRELKKYFNQYLNSL